MKFCRFSVNSGDASWGVLLDDRVQEIVGKPWVGKLEYRSRSYSPNEVVFLAPCEPKTVVGVAQNYSTSCDENKKSSQPLFFLKSPRSLNRSQDHVILPAGTSNAWGEAELAFLVGGNETSDQSLSIFGYLIANDITRENLDGLDHHLAYSKSPLGFCPVSNFLDSSFEPKDQLINADHNMVPLRRGRLSDRVLNDREILSALESWLPLEPGDLVLTGTPPRIRDRQYLAPGDTFDSGIEGLGFLRTYIG